MKAMQIARIVTLTLALASASCGDAVRQGTGTSFLIVKQLEFARGSEPDTFTANLLSDVVGKNSTVFNDFGRVTFSLGLKDPGPAGSPNAPTQNQSITVNRYHVRFFRADGRNTPGVDVPYEFDGAFTVTVGSSDTQGRFTVVRNIAKREAPLQALGGSPPQGSGGTPNPVILSTIAEITFYGQDLSGHEVSATARASIDFGNFAD
jgi:hypothetical protein